MSKARVIVSAVIVEGRSKAAVARDYGVARSWVYTLVDRYLQGGWDAIEPRSKRPTSNPRRISTELESEIVRLRQSLTGQGHDAGAHTIAFHLTQRHGTAPAVSTIWKDDRIDKAGVVTLRYDSRLHHIGVGRTHHGTRVKILVHDQHIRIIATETGQLLRDLILDPTRDYQPQTKNTPTE